LELACDEWVSLELCVHQHVLCEGVCIYERVSSAPTFGNHVLHLILCHLFGNVLLVLPSMLFLLRHGPPVVIVEPSGLANPILRNCPPTFSIHESLKQVRCLVVPLCCNRGIDVIDFSNLNINPFME